jgi:uncharacterized protein YecT (DUF1311 family)
MQWDNLTLLGLVAAAGGVPMAVQAEGPTFDCSTVKADVEKLICSDAALAALDRKLDAAYKAALAKAHAGPLVRQLRQEQRGWTKGRDDCWKANGQDTWITATWTVNTVRDCVDAQYRLRTSELQAVWRLLPPRTLSFACQGDPAKEVVANLFDTDPPTLRLERGDQTKTLWRVGVAGPGRYEGQNISLVYQVDTLKLEWLDVRTGQTDAWQCKAR